MDDNRFQKIVHFGTYCPQCKYRDYSDFQQPCYDCLGVPARTDGSHKPIKFKEEKKK